MIRTFLFDLGNVLVHFSEEKMQNQMSQLFSPKDSSQPVVDLKMRQLFEMGKVSTTELYQYLAFRHDTQVPFPQMLTAYNEVFLPNHSIYPLVRKLHEQGYRLVLLSNTSEAHFSHILEKFPVLEWFHEHVLSYEVGSLKPQLGIFEVAVRAAACPAHECFFIDDSLENVTAARSLDIDAEQYTGTPQLLEALQQRGVEV